MIRAARWLALTAFMLTGCEAVAPVDLHYMGNVGDAASDAVALADTGPVNVEEDDAQGPNGTCGCDFTAGESCCVPPGGAAFCTTNSAGCAQQGGIAMGCRGYDPLSSSDCCWNGAAGPGSLTALASGCVHGPTACSASSDCGGGKCNTTVCGGITVGACDVTPTCP